MKNQMLLSAEDHRGQMVLSMKNRMDQMLLSMEDQIQVSARLVYSSVSNPRPPLHPIPATPVRLSRTGSCCEHTWEWIMTGTDNLTRKPLEQRLSGFSLMWVGQYLPDNIIH